MRREKKIARVIEYALLVLAVALTVMLFFILAYPARAQDWPPLAYFLAASK